MFFSKRLYFYHLRYYFEPLFFVKDIQEMNRLQEFSLHSLYLLESLFNCSLEAVNRFLLLSKRNRGWKLKFYKFPPCNDCDQLQVAKVIRFQLDHDALAWLRSRHDIKVRTQIAIDIELQLCLMTEIRHNWGFCQK